VAKANIEHVRTKEFPATDAGRRIGWVALSKQAAKPEREFCDIDVITATVSENGAWEGYVEIKDVNKSHRYPQAEGFLDISGISATLSTTDEPRIQIADEESLRFHSQAVGDHDIMVQGLGHRYDGRAENKQWVYNHTNVIDLLKQGLADHNIEDCYGILYYFLNLSVARSDMFTKLDSAFGDYAIQDLLMPDKSMAQQTSGMISTVDDIIGAFNQSADNDKTMKHRLTGFTDLPKRKIPEVYQESRNTAHGLETKLGSLAAGLVLQRLIYVPTGLRTYPYMDASAVNDGDFGGHQRAELERQEVDHTNRELDREIKELEQRRDYAKQSAIRLQEIATAEKTA